jgi:hypothetical protein
MQEAIMTVTAYSQTQGVAEIQLPAKVQTVVVQLRLPTTGMFVIWGNVTIDGVASTPFNGFVMMTTLDMAPRS